MDEIERSIWMVFWIAIPLFVFIVDVFAIVFLRRYVRRAGGGPGSTLLRALLIFVYLTIIAQSTNLVLAGVVLYAASSGVSMTGVTLSLFLGGQLFRAAAISWFVWSFVKLHRGG